MGKDEGVSEWLRIKESLPIRTVARRLGARRKMRYARPPCQTAYKARNRR